MITIGNRSQDIENLTQAFRKLVHQRSTSQSLELPLLPLFNSSCPIMAPRGAFFANTEIVPINSAAGRISAELICPYPPGIPLIMPGEKITQQHLDYLRIIYEQQSSVITGCSDPNLNTLKVILN